MAILEWNDDFSVGLASVDYQHARLVEMINALDEAVSVGSDEQTLRQIIKDLYAYTEYHFTTEEEMMRAAGAPMRDHYVRHKAEHDRFTAKIRPLADVAPLDASTLNDALFDYLIRWLVDHILGSDKEMGHLIAELSAWSDSLDAAPPLQDVGEGVWEDERRDTVERNLLGALKESEARFRNLSDSVPVLIWVSDEDGERTFFNKTWRDFSGYGAEALLGGAWRQAIHPDDLARYLAAIDKARASGKAFNLEVRLQRHDGRYRWLYESTVPRLSPSGELIGLIGSAIDITERKAAEHVLVKARERLENEVARQTAQLRRANQQLQQEKNEQKLLLERLQATQDQLFQSEKMASIGQLAAGVAHEINNPVGFISSNLGSLKGYVTDLFRLVAAYERLAVGVPAAQRADVENLAREIDIDFVRSDLPQLISESQSGTRRVQRIVQDLKDFSHVDESEWQWSDLHEGLDSTLNMVRNEIKYKAEVVKEYGELPRVNCIPGQLNQVFMNLLVNGVQAIPEHGTISIRTGREGEQVWVEIADSGVGIAAEHLSRIFDPFFTTKPVGKGTGLGLSLAYGIVQKHGGRVDVDSTPGVGTRFRIWLPIDGSAAEAEEQGTATVDAP